MGTLIICFQFKLKDQDVKLLKIRNPWGRAADAKTLKRTGEWKGRWSFHSREWKDAPEKLQDCNVDVDIGGEFWICLEDFSRYFQTALMCMTIPDYEEEGFRKSDNLSKDCLLCDTAWIISTPHWMVLHLIKKYFLNWPRDSIHPAGTVGTIPWLGLGCRQHMLLSQTQQIL